MGEVMVDRNCCSNEGPADDNFSDSDNSVK